VVDVVVVVVVVEYEVVKGGVVIAAGRRLPVAFELIVEASTRPDTSIRRRLNSLAVLKPAAS